MADHYTQFSEEITGVTTEEKEWLERQLDTNFLDRVQKKLSKEYDCQGHELLAKVPDEVIQREGLALLSAYSEWGCLGFTAEFLHDDPEADPDSPSDCLWLWDGGNGCDIEQVGELVHAFLEKFRPWQCWSLTFSMSCSKPRIGEFSGGALIVTAQDVEQHTCGEWIEQRRREFRDRDEDADRGNPATPTGLIHSYADLSTAHLSLADAQTLDQGKGPLIAKYPEGYFLYVRDEEDEPDHAGDFTKTFFGLMTYARENGCMLIRLDADGPEIDSLPRFDW